MRVSSSVDEDFRSRTARTRRTRTGARLLEAVFQVTDERGLDGLSIDHVRNAAGLSRGSFYNYFDTLDAFLVEVSAAFGAVINQEQAELFRGETSRACEITGYLRYFVQRALSDRAGTAILLHTLPLTGAVSDQMRRRMLATFGEAAEAGEIDVDSLPVAVDVGMGVTTAMLRRALDDGPDPQRISQEAVVLLRGLGMPKRQAAQLAQRPLPPMPATKLREAVIRRGLSVLRVLETGSGIDVA